MSRHSEGEVITATPATETQQTSLYQMLMAGSTSPRTFNIGNVVVDAYVSRGNSADVLLHAYGANPSDEWGTARIELHGNPSEIEAQLGYVEQSLTDIERRKNDWIIEELLCASLCGNDPGKLLLGYYKDVVCRERGT